MGMPPGPCAEIELTEPVGLALAGRRNPAELIRVVEAVRNGTPAPAGICLLWLETDAPTESSFWPTEVPGCGVEVPLGAGKVSVEEEIGRAKAALPCVVPLLTTFVELEIVI